MAFLSIERDTDLFDVTSHLDLRARDRTLPLLFDALGRDADVLGTHCSLNDSIIMSVWRVQFDGLDVEFGELVDVEGEKSGHVDILLLDA